MTPYHRAMRRPLASALALVLAAAPAASAKNGSSLLSGYGGPGDGEQALLGGQLVVKGSGAARAPSAGAIYSRGAPAPGAVSPPGGSIPTTSSTGTNGATKDDRSASNPQPTSTPDGPKSARPKLARPSDGPGQKVARPNGARPSDVPGQRVARPNGARPGAVPGTSGAPAPLNGGDLGVLLAVLAGVLLLAGCARRLAVRASLARRRAARPLTG